MLHYVYNSGLSTFCSFFGPLMTDEFVKNNSFVYIKGPSILEIFFAIKLREHSDILEVSGQSDD